MEGQTVDGSPIVGQAGGPVTVSYNSRDLLIYALGIGCGCGSTDGEAHDETRYLYEGHPDFCAFPTYPLVLPYKGTSSDVVRFPGERRFRLLVGALHVAVVLGHVACGMCARAHLEKTHLWHPFSPHSARIIESVIRSFSARLQTDHLGDLKQPAAIQDARRTIFTIDARTNALSVRTYYTAVASRSYYLNAPDF